MIVTLEQAREWCRSNYGFMGNIKIASVCPHCQQPFQTWLFHCIIAPKFCSRECIDAAFPTVVVQGVGRSHRRSSRYPRRREGAIRASVSSLSSISCQPTAEQER